MCVGKGRRRKLPSNTHDHEVGEGIPSSSNGPGSWHADIVGDDRGLASVSSTPKRCCQHEIARKPKNIRHECKEGSQEGQMQFLKHHAWSLVSAWAWAWAWATSNSFLLSCHPCQTHRIDDVWLFAGNLGQATHGAQIRVVWRKLTTYIVVSCNKGSRCVPHRRKQLSASPAMVGQSMGLGG